MLGDGCGISAASAATIEASATAIFLGWEPSGFDVGPFGAASCSDDVDVVLGIACEGSLGNKWLPMFPRCGSAVVGSRTGWELESSLLNTNGGMSASEEAPEVEEDGWREVRG